MRIQVKLFAGLRDLLPEGQSPFPAEVPEGATVADALRSLRVPEEKPKILLVNGRHAMPDYALQEGDVLSVFPPVAGG
jgi:molybdopterin converting factor small subunit